jgi:hypothetical protein
MTDAAAPRLPREYETLADCRPALYRDILSILAAPAPDESGTPDVAVTPSRSGAPSMTINGRWVHSSINPEREADRALPSLSSERPRSPGPARSTNRGLSGGAPSDDPPSTDGTILVGIGLGYHLVALRRREASQPSHSRPLVGVVLHPAVLATILATHGPDWWCAHGPDRLVPGWMPGVLVPVLQMEEIRSFSVVTVRGEGAAFPDIAKRVDENLHRYRERVEVNRNTLHRFGPLWVRNTLHSVARYGVLPGIDDLIGSAPDTPAIVCAAGPTLDDVLADLPEMRDHALVIAVDTAVVALQRRGITPDVAVISDPQYWNTRHLDQVRASNAILVAEPATHPRTLRLWTGPRRVSASLFPLGLFFDSRVGRSHKLGAGGSVTTSAWDLARLLGSTAIALAGTDLGFPRYRTHCSGSFFETRLALVGDRLAPAEHGLWRYLHGARASMVPAAAGGTIPSDSRMHVYRSWFSEQAQQHPEVQTVLLSPASSAIPGIPWQAPSDWLNSLGSRKAVQDARDRLRRHVSPPTADAEVLLRELRESIGTIGTVAARGLSVCRQILEQRTAISEREVIRRLGALDAVDAALTASTDREVAGFVAAPVLDALTSATATTADAALENATALYGALTEAVGYHLELLDRYTVSRD